MEHSSKFELLKNYYETGLWSEQAVRKAVESEWITEEKYKEIVMENN